MTSDEYRAIRIHLGLTQAELAKELGTQQPNVARIERGDRQPTEQQAAALLLLVEVYQYRRAQGYGSVEDAINTSTA